MSSVVRYFETVALGGLDLDNTPPVVHQVAQDLIRECDYICFDEFQLADIGDATLLTALLRVMLQAQPSPGLIQSTVHIVFTSNKFMRGFVDLLNSSCSVHLLDAGRDYRVPETGYPEVHGLWLPDNMQVVSELCHKVRKLHVYSYVTPHYYNHVFLHLPCQVTLFVNNSAGVSKCNVPHTSIQPGIQSLLHHLTSIWTYATDLCDPMAPMGSVDFNVLAQDVHTLFLLGVPPLGLHNRDQSRRVVSLVDEAYQFGVNLIISSSSPSPLHIFQLLQGQDPSHSRMNQTQYEADLDDRDLSSTGDIYQERSLFSDQFGGSEDLFISKRCVSRLCEMQTPAYLRRGHLNMDLDDIHLEHLIELAADQSPARSGTGGELPSGL
eukprot:gene10678-1941_t